MTNTVPTGMQVVELTVSKLTVKTTGSAALINDYTTLANATIYFIGQIRTENQNVTNYSYRILFSVSTSALTKSGKSYRMFVPDYITVKSPSVGYMICENSVLDEDELLTQLAADWNTTPYITG